MCYHYIALACYLYTSTHTFILISIIINIFLEDIKTLKVVVGTKIYPPPFPRTQLPNTTHQSLCSRITSQKMSHLYNPPHKLPLSLIALHTPKVNWRLCCTALIGVRTVNNWAIYEHHLKHCRRKASALLQVNKGGQMWNGGSEFPLTTKQEAMESGSPACLSF